MAKWGLGLWSFRFWFVLYGFIVLYIIAKLNRIILDSKQSKFSNGRIKESVNF